MARLINDYCQKHHLIFIETGSHEGRPVLWFRDLEGRRVCVPIERLRT